LSDSLRNPLIGDDNIIDQSNGSSSNHLHESSDGSSVQVPKNFPDEDRRDFMLPSSLGVAGTHTDSVADLPSTTGGRSALTLGGSASASAPHVSATPVSAPTNPSPPPGASPSA
jgi:hypothetical protein